MIAIISDDSNQQVGNLLYKELSKHNEEVEYINAAKVDMKPCYNCGGCFNQTFGKCVIRDDGDKIFPILLQARMWIVVTPLRWGTYSFSIKRVLDKMAVIGDLHYYVKGKELIKGIQGNLKHFYAIGVKSKCSFKEKDVFTKLVNENVNIMGVKGDTYVVDSDITYRGIELLAKEIMDESSNNI